MSATQHVVTLSAPEPAARWIAFDIETGNAPEEAVDAAIANWKGAANWKPETIEAKRADAAAKIRDKAALLDASPIICIGARSDREAVMFSGMGQIGEIQGWRTVCAPDEAGMLAQFRAWLDRVADPETVLAGHNVRGFDLPKLRGAYVRNRQPLPEALRPREMGPGQPVTDTMMLFKHFSMEHRDSPFVGLDVVATAFGVPRPKQVISGADVPRLHAEGQGHIICLYCAIDVDVTAEVYRLMMS